MKGTVAVGVPAAVAAPFACVLVCIVALSGAADAGDAGGAGGGLKPGSVPAQFEQDVVAAGQVCGTVTAPLIAAQIEQESGWNPDAVSPAGAIGLSQVLPATWAQFGVDGDGDGIADPRNGHDAIATQARYDCWIAQYVAAVPGDPVDNMLAGYNAGPMRVVQFQGVPPYPETQQYIARIRELIPTYQAPLPVGTGDGGAIVTLAATFLGTPYVWGGTEPGGFDCSGLTSYVYLHAAGITIPRTSEAQAAAARPIPESETQPGDLIFFTAYGDTHHVGIVLGGGMMIDAPHTGAYVSERSYRGWTTGDVLTFGTFLH